MSAPLAAIQVTVSALAADELLVHVRYASLNAMDQRVQRTNLYQRPLPYSVGFDFSGTVSAQGVDGDLRIGEEIFGFTSAEGGCFAEYVVAKRERVELRGAIPPREAGAYGSPIPRPTSAW